MNIPNWHNKLTNFYNDEKTSDVLIIVGKESKKFYCHKLILAISSKFWYSTFYPENWKNLEELRNFSKIEIPDLSSEIFENFLKFIYKNEFNIKESNFWGLYSIGARFEIQELRELCENYCLNSITESNCLSYFEKSCEMKSVSPRVDKEGNPQMNIHKKIKKYLEKNSVAILSANGCLNKLKEKTILELLSNKNLQIEENEIFHRICERGEHLCLKQNLQVNSTNLRNNLKQLIPLIRVDLLNKDAFEEIRELKLLDTSKLITALFSKARKLEKAMGNNYALENRKRIQNRKNMNSKEKNTAQVLLIITKSQKKQNEDIVKSINYFGGFEIDIMSVNKRTPSYEDIANYDSIFLFSYADFFDSQKMGDLIARFIQDGGGLVICSVFSLVSKGLQGRIGGRLATDEFLPFSHGERISRERSYLGEIFDPDHKLMDQVKCFDGGVYSLRIKPKKIHPKARIIASWSDGQPLIAEMKKSLNYGKVVALNINPISNNVGSNHWIKSTDGAKIIANSIKFVSKREYFPIKNIKSTNLN
ncbi:btb/poz domain-containing [Anaeramoeba flamelloides]|uniref:Btb/poz domain-containing n=1 Tax=Anaeramoeba flamelloides TaxID=1746091 RepID=A0ABQ8Z2D6_9EUKA|nr:btb/poz domain-containing [Anaeramoeba flamelloides]